MPSASKVAEVEAIQDNLEGAVAALLTEYRGLNVKELAELRSALRGSTTEYHILKNTLAAIAADRAGHASLRELLDGPTAIAFVHGDPAQAAKDLADFSRGHPALVLKGGLVDGRVIGQDDVRRLATLEPRDVLLARLAGMLKAELQQAINVLTAPLRQVATMTSALRDERSSAAPAGEPGPAAEAAAATARATTPAPPAGETSGAGSEPA